MTHSQQSETKLFQPLTSYNQQLKSDFSNRKTKGKAGEDFVDRLLQNVLGYRLVKLAELPYYQKKGGIRLLIDVSEIAKYQKDNIDRLLIEEDSSEMSLEIKTDYIASRTANLFFEIERQGTPTWGMKSKADYFVFLIPKQEILFVKPCELRRLVCQNRTTLQEKTVRETNTVGLPIPIKTVQNIASYRYPLSLKL
jgi:hypothetical protein